MSQENYVSYQSMLTDVTTGIAELRGVCKELSLEEHANTLDQVKDRLQNHVFSVGIMGEFRRGKSTVINALLGQDIVPADIVPCSATLNYVRWSTDKYAEIHYKNGSVENVDVEHLSDYVTKITPEHAKKSATVDYSVVHYPCQFCQNGVQIVDTPGLNDDDRMDAIAQNVLPTLDAIIMVLVADSPFSKSEAEFVRNKVMSSDLGRIIFVVNKIDNIDEDDRDKLLDHIKFKIQDSVLEKMSAVYGKDSEEYKNAKDKLGEIRLLPISARNALKGKLKNDRRKYEESGYPEFEAMLCKLLTEERGMLELIHPVNTIHSVAKEAVRTIDMRLNAVHMEATDFKKVKEESLKTIKENRKKKKEEIKLLKAKGKTLYAEMLPDAESAYDEIENDIRAYVQQVNIENSDVENDASLKGFTDSMESQINQKITDVLSIQTERMMNKIHDQLGKDVLEMEAFGQAFVEDMETIHTSLSFSSKKTVYTDSGSGLPKTMISGALGTLAVCGVTLLTNSLIPGVGGLISGIRQHGAKGGVVGFLSGAGLGYAATVALTAATGGIITLPIALFAGIVSSFGGSAVTNLIFGRKPSPTTVRVTPDDIRRALLDSVDSVVNSMRKEKYLEKWLKNTCTETYEKVAEDADREWENALSTMERNISQIESDIAKKEDEKVRVEKDMQKKCQEIQAIVESLKSVYQKLNDSLVAKEPQSV